jgi:hypothetical protein
VICISAGFAHTVYGLGTNTVEEVNKTDGQSC